MKKILSLCPKIYDIHNSRECRRMFVFFFRSLANRKIMRDMFQFFEQRAIENGIFSRLNFCYEQVTRQFFYKNSTYDERVALIQDHFNFLISAFTEESLKSMYEGNGIGLYQDDYQGRKLEIALKFEGGQKKEGLLSVILDLDQCHLYQIIFWIAKDRTSDQMALWIGALQGSNDEQAQELIKGITKYFHGYRTKNLILYALRSIVHALNINKIYAVSNDGFYANNHIRIDRKIKTSLDEFWRETGGVEMEDCRFFELPVIEHRKSIEEVKTHKRNLYRKRFALLDALEEITVTSLLKYKR